MRTCSTQTTRSIYSCGSRSDGCSGEVSLRALKGSPLEWPKKTSEGREERLGLLEAVGIVPPLEPIRGAAPEDIIDASVAAWSAHRIATKRASPLPDRFDMAIWY